MEVVAKTIDSVHFSYECPTCWSNYKKNGEPSLRAKRVMHQHGSDGDLTNRKENRISHCLKNSELVIIHINDKTCRV